MIRPLVSVIIPSYNHGGYVQSSIQSIIDQDYENIELIIIDDGSRDDSVAKIKELIPICQRRFVRFEFRSRANKGVCATLNEALAWCKGIYFAPAASDDIHLSNKISKQVAALESMHQFGVVGVFSGIAVFRDNSSKVKEKFGSEQIFGFEEAFLRSKPMTGQSVMLIRQPVLDVGGYDPQFKVEDLNLFLKLTEKGWKLSVIKDIGVMYRKHDENFSSRHTEMWTAIHGILAQYYSHPLYSKALASSMMMHARSLLRSKRKRVAMQWAMRAVKESPSVFYDKAMVKFIARLCFPKVFL